MQREIRVARISTAHKVSASLLIIALVGLQARAIIGPYEDWPFGSCAMFSYYAAPESELFTLQFVVELEAGSERRLNALQDIGLPDLSFQRLTFCGHYGSTDPRLPQGHFPDDTRDAFRRRMEEYCRKLAMIMARKSDQPRAIRIEVAGTEDDSPQVVARYEVDQDLLVLVTGA